MKVRRGHRTNAGLDTDRSVRMKPTFETTRVERLYGHVTRDYCFCSAKVISGFTTEYEVESLGGSDVRFLSACIWEDMIYLHNQHQTHPSC